MEPRALRSDPYCPSPLPVGRSYVDVIHQQSGNNTFNALSFAANVIELKPDNPNAIAKGVRQLEAYLTELDAAFPGEQKWTGYVVTYDRP